MKNKYFSPDSVQKRIEEKIEKYTRAFKDEAVKNTLAKMPKNQETLSIIEAELETVVANMPEIQVENNGITSLKVLI